MAENREQSAPVLVLGGSGRVGSAVVSELAASGEHVVAVSRRVSASPHAARVEYRRGDISDLEQVLDGLRPSAVVIAVTPFTAPPESFDGFDTDYYARIVTRIEELVLPGTRVVDIAVTAIARLDDGTLVADHDELFPRRLRPFSDAHVRGADRLDASALNGTVLIPAAGLGLTNTGIRSDPLLVREPASSDDATAAISHATLATATVEQLALTNSGGSRFLVRDAASPLPQVRRY
ncbi:NAD(P)H-binding protein [Rhodococcoides fascians]|uniref:NAD(P)H-binding protein n=1 Tax=Rhodococcoides fascians TaxID=1828 RepID=UPI00068B8018|nr:NAD(P)H-binding protein [Rhodococcus fascians]